MNVLKTIPLVIIQLITLSALSMSSAGKDNTAKAPKINSGFIGYWAEESTYSLIKQNKCNQLTYIEEFTSIDSYLFKIDSSGNIKDYILDKNLAVEESLITKTPFTPFFISFPYKSDVTGALYQREQNIDKLLIPTYKGEKQPVEIRGHDLSSPSRPKLVLNFLEKNKQRVLVKLNRSSLNSYISQALICINEYEESLGEKNKL